MKVLFSTNIPSPYRVNFLPKTGTRGIKKEICVRIFRLGAAISAFSVFPMACPRLRHRVGKAVCALHGDGLVQELHLFPRTRNIISQPIEGYNSWKM